MAKQNTKSANVEIKLIYLLEITDLFLVNGQSPLYLRSFWTHQESWDSFARQVKSAFDFVVPHKALGKVEFCKENILVLNIHCTWLMWHFVIFQIRETQEALEKVPF
jgi:hypothetical protein